MNTSKPRSAILALFLTLAAMIAAGGCNAILGITEDPVVKQDKAGCLLSSECSGNLVCLFRVCSQPCSADKDCNRALGERCLHTEAGTACVKDEVTVCTGSEPTCPDGTSCAAGKCFSVCDGTPSSCLSDQRCESDRVCRARPAPDASVPPPPRPDAGAHDGAAPPGDAATTDGPGLPQCSPEDAARCEGNAQAARSICANGKWSTTEPCADGSLCDTVSTPAGQCATVEPRCFGREPGESFCDGATRVVCGPDLVSAETTACADAQHCSSVKTGCAACLDNEFKCDGASLLKCKADHTGFEPFKTCGDATSGPCNAQAGECTKDACTANQKRCNGDKLEQCNADRTAFVTLETCSAGLCDANALQCDKCVAKATSCASGKVRTCSDDGQTQTDTACPTDKPVCTGAGQCVACLDAGDCTAPAGGCAGKSCNAGVCGYPPIGANTGCPGGVCDGSGNCVECLSAAQCTAKGDCYTHVCGADHRCSYPVKNPGDGCSGGFCDGAGVCKGCLNSTQCTGAKPICSGGTCVACTTEAQCANKQNGFDHCRVATGTCVACTTSAQCPLPAQSICDAATFSCRGCTQGSPPTTGDTECKARNGSSAPACASGGTCANCTATNATACGGTTPKCNTATNTCVECLISDAACGAAKPICVGNACSVCTSNAQCAARSGSTPYCNTTTGTCAECLTNANCGGSNVCTGSNTCCTPDRVTACQNQGCGPAVDNCGTYIPTCMDCGRFAQCCVDSQDHYNCSNTPCQ